MKRLTIKKQKQSFGGSATMAAWVAIMGIGMLISSLTSVVSTVVQSVAPSSQQKSNYGYSSKKSAMVRMSAFPSRSAINFWL